MICAGREVVPSYLEAVADLPPFASGRSEAADVVRKTASEVRAAARGMRGWVAQIPRLDLPGRCVSIVTAFHNLPDPHLEEERAFYEDFQERGTVRNKRLVLFVATQVWQTETDDGAPRLIGANLEVVSEFDPRNPNELRNMLRSHAAAEKILCDPSRLGRQDLWGGSQRTGILWVDRSYGLLEPMDFAASYDSDALTPELPADITAALKAFAVRY